MHLNKKMSYQNPDYNYNQNHLIGHDMTFSHKKEGVFCASGPTPSIYGRLTQNGCGGAYAGAGKLSSYTSSLGMDVMAVTPYTVCNAPYACLPSQTSCVCRKEFQTWM